MATSRTQHLLTLVKALPATPLRPVGSPQLSTALENIIARSNPTSSSVDGMISSIERISAGAALRDVS